MRFTLAFLLIFGAALSATAQVDTGLLVTGELRMAPSEEDSNVACPEGDCPAVESEPETPLFAPGDTVTVFLPAPKFTFAPVAKIYAGSFPFSLGGTSWQGLGGCTGTLIHERVILTAQHCVHDKFGRVRPKLSFRFRETPASNRIHTQSVALNETNIALRRDGFTLGPDGLARWSPEFDLALVLLGDPVPDPSARVARLATADEIAAHRLMILVGYGKQFLNFSNGSTGGQRVLAFITSRDVPISISGGSLTSRSFSIQGRVVRDGVEIAAGLCNGDSGGPFFIARSSDPTRMLLAGVNHAVSFGNTLEACLQPNNRSFLVGVIGNKDFIDAGLAKFGIQ